MGPLFAKPGFNEPWGKDSDLKIAPLTKKETLSFPVKVADAVIVFHQKVISPVDGPRSHFRPSSSRYMQLAMRKHGFIKGYIMGCDRLLRENKDPWVYRSIEDGGIRYNYDPP